jgi:hypothetical protein
MLRLHKLQIQKQTNKTRGKKNNMTPIIELTLQASSAEALDIPNPNKTKTVVVPCITRQKVRETLAELQKMVLMSNCNNQEQTQQVISIHEDFVWAAKQLEIQNK